MTAAVPIGSETRAVGTLTPADAASVTSPRQALERTLR